MRRTRIMDRFMRRDGRMPYDMRRDMMPRRDRTMRDRRMEEDYNYGEDYRYDKGHQYNEQDGGTRYPFMVEGEFGRYDGHYYNPYYHYPMMRDYRGDYGETLSNDELMHWHKRLSKQLDGNAMQFFSKENIAQKAHQLGIDFKHFNEQELATAALMLYSDYCMDLKPIIGSNMDIYVKMAKSFLTDPDASVKGGEKLAVYFDCIVEGEDD